MVFVDTGAWFALLVPKDPNHLRITEWFASLNEQVSTSDYVVDETLTLLLMRGERKRAIEFGNSIIVNSRAKLHKVSEQQFHRSWILFQRLAEAGLSFTDCTSHIVASDLNVIQIASFDKHFETTGRFVLVP